MSRLTNDRATTQVTRSELEWLLTESYANFFEKYLLLKSSATKTDSSATKKAVLDDIRDAGLIAKRDIIGLYLTKYFPCILTPSEIRLYDDHEKISKEQQALSEKLLPANHLYAKILQLLSEQNLSAEIQSLLDLYRKAFLIHTTKTGNADALFAYANAIHTYLVTLKTKAIIAEKNRPTGYLFSTFNPGWVHITLYLDAIIKEHNATLLRDVNLPNDQKNGDLQNFSALLNKVNEMLIAEQSNDAPTLLSNIKKAVANNSLFLPQNIEIEIKTGFFSSKTIKTTQPSQIRINLLMNYATALMRTLQADDTENNDAENIIKDIKTALKKKELSPCTTIELFENWVKYIEDGQIKSYADMAFLMSKNTDDLDKLHQHNFSIKVTHLKSRLSKTAETLSGLAVGAGEAAVTALEEGANVAAPIACKVFNYFM